MKQPKITRFFHRGAQCVLIEDDKGLAAVSTLYSQKRGQGHARAVMEKIVKYADQHNLTLRLVARQFGDTRGLNDRELIIFYEKFGFTTKGSHALPTTMVRYPSQETPAL